MSGWKFGATAASVTPATGVPNIVLETAQDEFASVMEFSWGGEVTSTNVMHTAFARAAEGAGAATAVDIQLFVEGQSAAATASTLGDHTTTPPAKTAGALWATSWNAHGGIIRWLAAPGEEVIMLGVATVVLENSVGTSVSSYGFVWSEY